MAHMRAAATPYIKYCTNKQDFRLSFSPKHPVCNGVVMRKCIVLYYILYWILKLHKNMPLTLDFQSGIMMLWHNFEAAYLYPLIKAL